MNGFMNVRVDRQVRVCACVCIRGHVIKVGAVRSCGRQVVVRVAG